MRSTSSGLQSAAAAVNVQLVTRVGTFLVNLLLTRLVDARALGTAYVSFGLLESLSLTFTKEAFRRAAIREPSGKSKTAPPTPKALTPPQAPPGSREDFQKQCDQSSRNIASLSVFYGTCLLAVLSFLWAFILSPPRQEWATDEKGTRPLGNVACCYRLAVAFVAVGLFLQIVTEPLTVECLLLEGAPVERLKIEGWASLARTIAISVALVALHRSKVHSLSTGLLAFGLGHLAFGVCSFLLFKAKYSCSADDRVSLTIQRVQQRREDKTKEKEEKVEGRDEKAEEEKIPGKEQKPREEKGREEKGREGEKTDAVLSLNFGSLSERLLVWASAKGWLRGLLGTPKAIVHVTAIGRDAQAASSSSSSCCDGRTFLLPAHLRILESLLLLAIQKTLLNEAERLALLIVFSNECWALYALVSTLGSLPCRLIFAPLEETAAISFSRGGRSDSKPEVGGGQDLSSSGDRLQLTSLWKFLAMESSIGLAFAVIAGPVAGAGLLVLYGLPWVARGAHLVLQAYCIQLLLLSINGVLEGYMVSTATAEWLGWLRWIQGLLWLFEMALVCALRWIAVSPYGEVAFGLTSARQFPVREVLALLLCNMVSITLRIAVFLIFFRVETNRRRQKVRCNALLSNALQPEPVLLFPFGGILLAGAASWLLRSTVLGGGVQRRLGAALAASPSPQVVQTQLQALMPGLRVAAVVELVTVAVTACTAAVAVAAALIRRTSDKKKQKES